MRLTDEQFDDEYTFSITREEEQEITQRLEKLGDLDG
jgi:hypothetical protein